MAVDVGTFLSRTPQGGEVTAMVTSTGKTLLGVGAGTGKVERERCCGVCCIVTELLEFYCCNG